MARGGTTRRVTKRHGVSLTLCPKLQAKGYNDRFPSTAMVERIQAGRLREGGLKARLVMENDLDEMIKAWEEWAASEEASLAMLHGEIII